MPTRAAPLAPEARRAALVAATRPLLVEYGEMVTTRQIAEAAGVAEGTIFRVFADKEALLAATLDEALDMDRLELALSEIDLTDPLADRLAAAVDILQRRVVDVWRLVSNLGSRLQERARRPLSDSDALAALFAPDADIVRASPADAARLLRALTMSLTHPMLVDEPVPPARIVDVFLHGVTGARLPPC